MAIFEQFETGAIFFFVVRAIILLAEAIYLLVKKGLKCDVLPNFLCGGIIYVTLKLWQYAWVYACMLWLSEFALFSIDTSWWLLLLCIPLADLSYYVYHYCAHRSRLFWADHSVHHSSTEFDFSTNLRHSFVTSLYSWWPITPFLLIGIPPLALIWARALVNDYTFFLHTRYIGKLGWFEKVFNTPSHHRVHHSQNPEYKDKNFGFMFILWDKWFGTYAEEVEPCRFGIQHGPATRNPVTVIFHEWLRLAKDFTRTRGLRAKLRVLLGAPQPS